MDATARALSERADRSRGQSMTGIYRRMQGAYAVVSLLGEDVAIPAAGLVQPVPDTSVQVELRDGGYVMLGPVVAPPTRGRVTATGTPRITVLGSDGVSYSLPYMSAYSPAVNDDVAMEWTGEGGLVKGRVSTTPVPPPPPAPVETVTEYHPSPFLATAAGYHVLSTGALNTSWYPNYANGQAAAAWYGSAVADSIPDGATITSARIYLAEIEARLAGPSVQAIGPGPGSRSAVGSVIPLGGRSGWVALPFEVVDLLKTAPRGISLVQSVSGQGLSRYQTLSADPMSFALDIAWRA